MERTTLRALARPAVLAAAGAALCCWGLALARSLCRTDPPTEQELTELRRLKRSTQERPA